jgi:hypothetical protein
MSGITHQQILHTNDGTDLVVDSWLKDEDTITMSPSTSKFTGTCPEHGVLETGYVSMLVGFAIVDHAKEYHGGLVETKDLLDVGPSIQL